MLAADQSLANSMAATLLPPALKLVQSSLLQGSALQVRSPFESVYRRTRTNASALVQRDGHGVRV
jgi:hypothetical protein